MSMLHAYRRADGNYVLAQSWTPLGVREWDDPAPLYLGTVSWRDESDECLRWYSKGISYVIVPPEQFYSGRRVPSD